MKARRVALVSRFQHSHHHPVLGMCASAATVIRDDAGNRKLSKRKSSGRIESLVALTMAMGVAPMQAPPVDVAALIA